MKIYGVKVNWRTPIVIVPLMVLAVLMMIGTLAEDALHAIGQWESNGS